VFVNTNFNCNICALEFGDGFYLEKGIVSVLLQAFLFNSSQFVGMGAFSFVVLGSPSGLFQSSKNPKKFLAPSLS